MGNLNETDYLIMLIGVMICYILVKVSDKTSKK